MYNYSQEKEHFIYIGFGNVIPNQQSEYRLYKLSCLDSKVMHHGKLQPLLLQLGMIL